MRKLRAGLAILATITAVLLVGTPAEADTWMQIDHNAAHTMPRACTDYDPGGAAWFRQCTQIDYSNVWESAGWPAMYSYTLYHVTSWVDCQNNGDPVRCVGVSFKEENVLNGDDQTHWQYSCGAYYDPSEYHHIGPSVCPPVWAGNDYTESSGSTYLVDNGIVDNTKCWQPSYGTIWFVVATTAGATWGPSHTETTHYKFCDTTGG